ncbi:MAG: PilT/PilU family type 4a pilus ATPase [Elusimicrobiota bacterium]|jgi:twitching motility protein PilT
MDVAQLLKLMVEKGISDLHMKADAPPAVRVHGRLVQAANLPKLSSTDVERIAAQLQTPEQQARSKALDEFDFAYDLEGVARFRVNLFRQRGGLALSLRVVPLKVRSFEELRLPQKAMDRLAQEGRGLILFAGITGAGKTTSMNSFLHHLNATQTYRIVTIEDPVEFHHADLKSSVVQREVGRDTRSFSAALKYVLRQDPDVVALGEMRDPETVEAALTAAETGHLVVSTIHTMDAAQTVDRIVDSFSERRAAQVRQQLGYVLKGVVAQRLVMLKDGSGRIPATEVLVSNSAVRRHIAEGRAGELTKAMEGGDYYGMHTFDQDLLRLCGEGVIDEQEALENATNAEDLSLKLRSKGS